MRAVVLVGGEGTRLRPLTYTTPKQLLPVAEVTMIERVVSHLAAHDIDDVVLSMGYQPDAFLAAFPDGRCAGLALHYAVEPERMDTGGGIRFAADAAGIDEPFLVVNGDVLTDLDIGALIKFHRDRKAEATITLTPVDDPSAFGVVPTEEGGRVLAFIEKPDRESSPTNLINAGFYVFEPEALHRIPPGQPVHVETDVFPDMVDEGRLFALPTDAYWTDTGTPELYLKANLDLVAGRRGGPPAAHAKEREARVWTLGAGVIDGEVDPPSLIGDAAFIAKGAAVRDSVIGAGARVETGALVTGSVVMPAAVIGPEAVVDGSIVGEGAVVGRAARLSGLSVVQGGTIVDEATVHRGEKLGAGPVSGGRQ